mgnify:CR=1 FL=1
MQASGCQLIIKSSTQATYGDAPREDMPLHEGYNAEGTHRFNVSNLAGGAWNGTRQLLRDGTLIADVDLSLAARVASPGGSTDRRRS